MEQIELEILCELSRTFGGTDYVRGGGGNTSVKDSDTLWIKPSGTALQDLTPEKLVGLERDKVAQLFQIDPPAEASEREQFVKEVLEAAICPDSAGRPSVETPLHNLFSARYVIHTHPALLNGLLCSARAREEFGVIYPEALWMDAVDPGYTLSVAASDAVKGYVAAHGREPAMLGIQNHGVFIAADSPDAIIEMYAGVMKGLREAYAASGRATELAVAPLHEDLDVVVAAVRDILGDPSACVAVSGSFPVSPGPLTPDHIVYSKAYPLTGVTSEGVAAFRAKHGYDPRVFIGDGWVATATSTQKMADLAMELAQDGALIEQLTPAFGGTHYMTDRARLFIEGWEVEAYRAKMAESGQ